MRGSLSRTEAVDSCLFPLPIVGKRVRSACEPTGILSSFDMKKPALAGYSHVEGRRSGRPLHCDRSPSPLSRGKGGTDPKLSIPLCPAPPPTPLPPLPPPPPA